MMRRGGLYATAPAAAITHVIVFLFKRNYNWKSDITTDNNQRRFSERKDELITISTDVASLEFCCANGQLVNSEK